MIHTYTGAGSRETLSEVLEEMRVIGESLAWAGFTLRSGGAGGADRAFEEGARRVFGTRLEIYLPWRRFNDNPSPLYTISPQAFTLASKVHPAWDRLSAAAKKLHVRNCHQVLVADFASPSAFVVCWAPDGCESVRTHALISHRRHRHSDRRRGSLRGSGV